MGGREQENPWPVTFFMLFYDSYKLSPFSVCRGAKIIPDRNFQKLRCKTVSTQNESQAMGCEVWRLRIEFIGEVLTFHECQHELWKLIYVPHFV